MLPSGCRFGRYEVHGLIASVGTGDVYRAHDTRLDRTVALKVLPAGACDPDRFARFALEARTTALVNHPNIVAVHDAGIAEGLPFVVSELLQGETLRTRLRGGALPVPVAIGFATQMARGLIAAHHLGVIHADLKPENIIVSVDDRVKIVDFGLARCRGGALIPDARSESELPNPFRGTVAYLSPEHVSGGSVDERSDIFSFGAILYEMIAGATPFQAETLADALYAILRDAPRPLAARPGLTPDLQHVIQHCLEKAPAARFQSARDLAFVLEFTQRAPSPPPPSRPMATRRLIDSVLRLL